MPEPSVEQLETTLKRSVAALRDARVPYLLAGSLASWARGGPLTRHDLDLVVKPEDAERALAALEEAGMRPERPPEEWLLKAWDGDVLVDLIFAPTGLEVTDEAIERGEWREVVGMGMRVMTLEDLLVTKLWSLDEHNAQYEVLVGIARSVREQVDWAEVRARTASSPFADAFFVLLQGLGILEPSSAEAHGGARISVGPGLSALEGGAG